MNVAPTRALDAARASGLIRADEPLLVMLSGGADSVCLLDVAVRLGARVSAFHVNYGLRPEADGDEAHCREVCGRLGVPIIVERVELPQRGNLQAAAREARYSLAERHAVAGYAAAHTASDQAETVLYRLVSSPGRRALVGMRPRRRRLVRPLLEVTRAETRAHCEAAGIGWREDASNLDRRFARVRVREEVLPLLGEIAPAAERTIARTSRVLAGEAELLDELAERTLADLTTRAAEPALAHLRRLPWALARLVLLALAARSVRSPSLSADDVDAILALDSRGGTAELDLGGGLRAVSEYGRLRFAAPPARAGAAGEGRLRGLDEPLPSELTLRVPGVVRFGAWVVEARPVDGASGGEVMRPAGGAPLEARLDAGAIAGAMTVRSWRPGDRVRPAGLGGTKKLQDVFVDAKLPRARRAALPLIEIAGEIAWVPGIAVGEAFRARPGEPAVALRAARD